MLGRGHGAAKGVSVGQGRGKATETFHTFPLWASLGSESHTLWIEPSSQELYCSGSGGGGGVVMCSC